MKLWLNLVLLLTDIFILHSSCYNDDGIKSRDFNKRSYGVADRGLYVDYYGNSPVATLPAISPIDPRLHHRKSYAALENEYDDDYSDDDDDDDEDDDYDADSRDDDEEDLANQEEDEAIDGRKRESLRLVHYLRTRAALAAKLVRRRFNDEKLRQYNLDLDTRAMTSKLSNYRNDLNQELLWKLEMLSNHHYNQPGRDIEPLAPNLNNIPIQGHSQEITADLTLGDVMNGQNTPHNSETAARLREHLQSTELMRQAEFYNPVQAEQMESSEPEARERETFNGQPSQPNLQPPPAVGDPIAVADKATYSFAPLAGDISKAATRATAQHLYDKFAAMDDNLIKLANTPGNNFMVSGDVRTSGSVQKQPNLNAKKKSAKRTTRRKKTKISRRRRKEQHARKRSEKMGLKSALKRISPVNSKHNNKLNGSINATDIETLIGVQRALVPITDSSTISGKDFVSFKRTLWTLNHIIEMLLNSTKREETPHVSLAHTETSIRENPQGNVSTNNKTTEIVATSSPVKATPVELTKSQGTTDNKDTTQNGQRINLNQDIMKKYIKYKKYLRQLRKETQSRITILSNDNTLDDTDDNAFKREEKLIDAVTKMNQGEVLRKMELTATNPQPTSQQNDVQIPINFNNKNTSNINNKTQLSEAKGNETLQQERGTIDYLRVSAKNVVNNGTTNTSFQQDQTKNTTVTSSPSLQFQQLKNTSAEEMNNNEQDEQNKHQQKQLLKTLSAKAKEQSRSVATLGANLLHNFQNSTVNKKPTNSQNNDSIRNFTTINSSINKVLPSTNKSHAVNSMSYYKSNETSKQTNNFTKKNITKNEYGNLHTELLEGGSSGQNKNNKMQQASNTLASNPVNPTKLNSPSNVTSQYEKSVTKAGTAVHTDYRNNVQPNKRTWVLEVE